MIGYIRRFAALRREADGIAKDLIFDHGRASIAIAGAAMLAREPASIDRVRNEMVESRVRRFYGFPEREAPKAP